MADPIIRLKRSSIPGKIPLTSDLELGELAVNTHDGTAYLKKDVEGIETVVNIGGGYPGQTYYVTKTGLDSNSGETISSAFATLKKALTVAVAGDTIQISSGTFTEIFPLTVPQGVTVRGNGIRSTFIQPTSETERTDAFLLNGETTIEELSLGNFYYNSSTDTGYGFKFAPNMVTTTRSPYIQRITVLNKGSTQTADDPYGFDTIDNYPVSKVAGRGALIDASVVQSTTLEPAMLFNECTFITPNQTGLKMTNGARTEWVNCFTYFASIGIDGVTGSVGVGSTANAQLKLSGVTTSLLPNYVVKYYQVGTPVAIGTVVSVNGDYVTILGKGSGAFNSVGIGSTQDVRIFQSDGVTQVGSASTILWADYQKFGADMRSIGSATNFGTVGVRGDGLGVQLRLFGFNFGAVGSGKTFTQDPTLTIKENEAIQVNGGRVYYQSVDQAGNFRVGTLLEIGQETGLVSIASTSDINVTGTLTLNRLDVGGIATFRSQIDHFNTVFNTNQPAYNLINDNATTVNFAGAGTDITIGSETGVTTVRNYTVNLSGGQDSYTSTTGTLQVDGGVGISSNLNVGKDLRITGVSTFASDVEFNTNIRTSGIGTINNLNVTGFSTFNDSAEFDNDVLVSGITTLTTLRITGISTLMGDVELENNIRVAGVSTFNSDSMINAHLNVTGITTTGNFRVTGVSTLTGDTNLSNNLNVLGITTTGNFRVTGVSTLTGDTNFTNNANVSGITTTATFRVTGISTLMGDVELNNALRVAGVSTFNSDSVINAHLNVTGITTTGNLRVTGVSTLSGDTNFTNNLNISGITTTATFRVTGISTLMGDVRLDNNLFVSGISTFNNTISHNSQLFITNQSTYRFIDTTTTTVTAFGDATNIGIGSTNATLTLRPSTVVGSNTTQNIYNTVASTVNAFGAATTLNIGEASGTTTLRSITVVGSNTTQNLYNTVATTVNAFGVATTLNLGATSGTLTLRNPTVVGTQATQNLYNTVATTVNAFGQATTIGIGSTNATLTLRSSTVVGSQATQNLYNTVATTVNAFGQATNVNIGANSGTLTLRNPTVVGTQVAQNLYNTVATTISAFGEATTIGIGSTNATLSLRPSTVVGSNTTQNLYNTVATTVNAFGSATTLNLGATSGTLTLGNPTVVGTQATQNLYNTVATTVNAFGSATTLNLGATTGITTIRNNQLALPNATLVTIDGNNPIISGTSTGTLSLFNQNLSTVNAFGQATTIGIGSTNATLTLRPSTVVGSNTTQNLYNTVATTVNAFGQATNVNIGANSGTTTLRSNTIVGVNATQNIYNTVATNINAFGNASSIVIGSTSGITTIQSSTVKFGGTVVDSNTSNSSLFPSPTTLSAFAGASSFIMGPNVGGAASIRYSTITLPNTTTLNVNGANPTIAASSTGTLSLFNSNISRVVAFGNATDIVIGSATTTGITTIRTTISTPNGIEASGLIVGIITVFDTNFGINALNSGTSSFNNIDVLGVTTLGGRVDIFGQTNLTEINSSGTFTTQNFEVIGVGTFLSDLRVSGDLIVDGTTVTVNSVTMTVDDKNIELGSADGGVGLAGTVVSGEQFIYLDENGFDTTTGIIPGMEIFVVSGVGTVASGAKVVNTTKYTIEVDLLNPTSGEIIFNTGGPTEFTADGGGITLLASSDFSNNKRFSWLRATNAWSTQENINIESSNSSYLIAGASVLDFNTVITPNAYHTGIITAFNVDLSSGIITAFNAVFGNITNNFGLYAVGISSFNEAYISSGIVTGLTADYFTLTNTRSLIATQNNTIIGPSTNKIAIDTTGLAPEMRVFSSGPELLNNTTILSIDEPGVITITPLSVNVVQTTTSTLTVYDDPQAGVASISVLKADVGIVTNFDTLNANITGITTAQRLYVNTDIYTPGISSANIVTARVGLITFVSGNNITYSGIGTIGTLYSNVGFVTNIMGTNLQYTGISTLPNLITNVGFITHLSGTDIEYTGVSTLPNLITNVGFITTIYGNDLQLTGVTTVPTLRVNTGFVTTISGTRATYSDIDNTNLYNIGIASFTDIRTNIGLVTTITGTDLNYSGIGTINDFYANFAYSGIGTIDSLTSNDITISNTLDVFSFISDIGTITLLDVDFLKVAGILTVPVIENEVISISTATVSSIGATTITVEDLFFDRASSVGILTVSNLNAITGFITSYTGKEIDVGVATVTTIENQYLNTSGIGTIENLFTNIGIVTTLTSDYILSTNYIVGIGSSAVTIGVTTTIIGISTADILLGDLISGPSGIETGTTVVGYAGEGEIIISPPTTNNSPVVGVVTFSRDNQAGIASITTLKTNVGFVTTISGTDLYYIGIATANNLYTNIGIVTFLSGTNLNYSGITTLGVVEASNLQINNITNTNTIRTNVGFITHLSGTDIEYTGVSTLPNLITNVGLITYITGQNLKITGVTTSTIIRSEDLNVSGITTTNYLRVGADGTVLTADASSGIGSVGINTSVPNAALHLYGDMQFNGNVLVGTISTTLTSNAEQTVQTLSSVDFRSVEYTVQVSTGNTHQITKILTIHDGVTAYNSEYSNISTGIDIASFNVVVDNSVPPGYIGLKVTPVSNVDPTLVTVNFSAIRI